MTADREQTQHDENCWVACPHDTPPSDREQTRRDAPVDPFFVLEAVNSVALSHAENCSCTTCRASHGDSIAFASIMAVLNERQKAKR